MRHLATDLPGGTEYCSDQRNRCYVRKFDWDEARARVAAGEPVAVVARALGVTPTAVKRIVDPAVAQSMNDQNDRLCKSGRCWDCGAPCLPESHPGRRGGVPRCVSCSARARRSVWWENADGTLTVRCTMCHQWKDESDFGPQLRKRYDAGEAPAGGTRTCRSCGASARRLYRATHPEQADRERAYDRERWKRDRSNTL